MLLQGFHWFGKGVQWHFLEDAQNRQIEKIGKRKTSISTGPKIVWPRVCLEGPHCFYMFHKIDQKCLSNLYSQASIQAMTWSTQVSQYSLQSTQFKPCSHCWLVGFLNPLYHNTWHQPCILPLAYCALMSLSWPCGWFQKTHKQSIDKEIWKVAASKASNSSSSSKSNDMIQ